MIKEVIGGLVKPISDAFSAREERKKVVSLAKANAESVKTEGKQKLQLSDKQWEMLSKQAENGTWKDEYITLIITSPILSIFIGSFVAAFTGDLTILNANSMALAELAKAGVDMGELMLYTVLAAIGIKFMK